MRMLYWNKPSYLKINHCGCIASMLFFNETSDVSGLICIPSILFQMTGPRYPIHVCLYPLSGKTSYRKISWSLEAARIGFKFFQLLWHLAGTSAALLPRCLSNFRAIRPLQHPISWLRDITRFGGKTSYRLVNRGPGPFSYDWHTITTHNFVGCYDYAHFEHIENNHEKYRAIAHNGIYT